MSSFINAIKGAIWEETPTTQSTAQPAVQPAPATNGSLPATSMTASVSPLANEDMVKAIKNNTMNRKTPYTALLEAAEKLANVIPDPTTRLKAAYAMVGEQRTVDAIVKAIEVHISDVEGEKLRFTQATENRRKSELGAMNQQLTSINLANDQAQREIAALQERIASLSTMINDNSAKATDIAAQINHREVELNHTQQQFEYAAQTVRTELEQQRTAITSTLNS